MAEFNLKLNINGIETAVASVEDLESALKATKTEMNTLQIGSEAFNVAAQNAQKLDSALKNVKLATEGVDTKQLAGSFAKLGETVTGAFAIATNAVGLFGKENEDVSKAAVKAQQAIAVVMGARAIAEGVVEGRIAARLLLEKVTIANQAIMTSLFGAQAVALSAQAVATGEATVAQYALNTAMEANPIGLVILAITALVGAFALLADSEEDEIERTERLNKIKKEQAEQVDKEVAAIRSTYDAKVSVLTREKDLMIAKGATEKELFEQEKKINQERLNMLSYIKGYRAAEGGLNAKELEEQKDLQNQKLVEEAKYNATVIKSKEDLSKKVTSEKEKQAAKSAAIDEKLRLEQERLDLAATEGELAKLEVRFKQNSDFLDRELSEGRYKYEQYLIANNQLLQDYNLQKRAIEKAELTEKEKERLNEIKAAQEFYAVLNNNRDRLTAEANSRRTDLEKVAEEEKNAAIIASDKSKNDRLILAGEAFQNDVKAQSQAEKEIVRQAAQEKEQIEIKFQEKIREIRAAEFEKALQETQKYTDSIAQIGNSALALVEAVNAGKKEADDRALNDLRDANAAQESANNEHYNAEYANLNTQLANGQITREQYAIRTKELDQKQKKDKEALEKAYAAKEDALRKAAFEREKKSKRATIIMSTITGSIAAFTGMAQAIPGPYGLIAGGIAAALVVALGAVQLSNLEKTKYDAGPPSITPVDTSGGGGVGGGGDGSGAIGGGGSGGGITSFNPALTGAPAGGGAAGGGGSNAPIRVYVVESDITNTQRSVSVAESNATF